MEIDRLNAYLEILGFKEPSLIKVQSGESNILYVFDTKDRKVVVKTSNPIMGWNNLKREYDNLRLLSDKTNISPCPYDYNDDFLGRPLEVIEYIEGESLSPNETDMVCDLSLLAKVIHHLDIRHNHEFRKYKSQLDFLLEIEDYTNKRMNGLSRLEVPGSVVGLLKRIVSRGNNQLKDRQKYFTDSNLTFCHKDFKPDNIIVSPLGELKVIDWEYADICDPAFDLALLIGGLKLTREDRSVFIDRYDRNDTSIEQRIDTYISYGRIPSLIWCVDRLFNQRYKPIRAERAKRYLAKARENIDDLNINGVIEEKEMRNLNLVLENC